MQEGIPDVLMSSRTRLLVFFYFLAFWSTGAVFLELEPPAGGELGSVLELLDTSNLELRTLSTAVAANVLAFSDSLLLTNEESIDGFFDCMEVLLDAVKRCGWLCGWLCLVRPRGTPVTVHSIDLLLFPARTRTIQARRFGKGGCCICVVSNSQVERLPRHTLLSHDLSYLVVVYFCLFFCFVWFFFKVYHKSVEK